MSRWRWWLVTAALLTSSCRDFGAAPGVNPPDAINPDTRVALSVERPSYGFIDTVQVAIRNNGSAPLYAWLDCQGREQWLDGAWVDLPALCWSPGPTFSPAFDEVGPGEAQTVRYVVVRPGIYRAVFVCYDAPSDTSPRIYRSKTWAVQ